MMNKQATYYCNVCKDTSSSIEGHLKNYELIHASESFYECAICSQYFNLGYLVTDQESAPSECRTSCKRSMNNPSECVDICEESRFENQGENNQPNKSKEKLHKYNVYASSFKHQKNLTMHKRTRIHLNDLRCKVCNENFSYKSRLDRHMLKHTHLRPHKCNICNLDYKEERNLKRHMLTHSNNNPFKCKQCNKSCTSKYDLAIHMAKHSDERPHKCSRYSAAFKLKCHLTCHVKICNDIINKSNIYKWC